jgi:hypothetical protein
MTATLYEGDLRNGGQSAHRRPIRGIRPRSLEVAIPLCTVWHFAAIADMPELEMLHIRHHLDGPRLPSATAASSSLSPSPLPSTLPSPLSPLLPQSPPLASSPLHMAFARLTNFTTQLPLDTVMHDDIAALPALTRLNATWQLTGTALHETVARRLTHLDASADAVNLKVAGRPLSIGAFASLTSLAFSAFVSGDGRLLRTVLSSEALPRLVRLTVRHMEVSHATVAALCGGARSAALVYLALESCSTIRSWQEQQLGQMPRLLPRIAESLVALETLSVSSRDFLAGAEALVALPHLRSLRLAPDCDHVDRERLPLGAFPQLQKLSVTDAYSFAALEAPLLEELRVAAREEGTASYATYETCARVADWVAVHRRGPRVAAGADVAGEDATDAADKSDSRLERIAVVGYSDTPLALHPTLAPSPDAMRFLKAAS